MSLPTQPGHGASIAARLHTIQTLYSQGVIGIWRARDLLGGSIPGNPDPHAPANRKERPWHAPRPRA